MQNQHLYMFLANNNSILTTLRGAVDKCDGYKDVLAELVATSCIAWLIRRSTRPWITSMPDSM